MCDPRFKEATELFDAEAFAQLFRAVAEEGHSQAILVYGNCLQMGYGVTKDLAEAENWYRKALGRSNGKAEYRIGSLHEETDQALALDWYVRSSGYGYEPAELKIEKLEKAAVGLLSMPPDERCAGRDGSREEPPLVVVAHQGCLDTLAVMYGHCGFEKLVNCRNIYGELPIDMATGEVVRSVLSVSRHQRALCLLWCFDLLQHSQVTASLASLAVETVREICNEVTKATVDGPEALVSCVLRQWRPTESPLKRLRRA